MPRLALFFVLCSAIALCATRPAGAASEQKKSSELKAAAERANQNRADGTKARVRITNETVRQSKGQLKTLPPLRKIEEAAPEATTVNVSATSPRLEAAKERVEAVLKELRRVEEDYYRQPDPDYRERVVRVGFDLTRDQLVAARAELAAARDELSLSDPD